MVGNEAEFNNIILKEYRIKQEPYNAPLTPYHIRHCKGSYHPQSNWDWTFDFLIREQTRRGSKRQSLVDRQQSKVDISLQRLKLHWSTSHDTNEYSCSPSATTVSCTQVFASN